MIGIDEAPTLAAIASRLAVVIRLVGDVRR
jgi:hypothetical protein